jgi:macrolide transport system ATP-binding/permease protein
MKSRLLGETLFRDIGYGARLLVKSPGFTLVAVISLALGIGANTAVFTVLNAIFFDSLAVNDIDRLVAVYGTRESTGGSGFLPVSFPNYRDYLKNAEMFSGVALYTPADVNYSGTTEPKQISGLVVTGNYFEVLGVKLALGRGFLEDEDRIPGANPVVVLSYEFWQRELGGDSSVIGSSVRLNTQRFTVIGVAPRRFRGISIIDACDFWAPTMMHDTLLVGLYRPMFDQRNRQLFYAVGRLKPSVSISQARGAVELLAGRLRQQYPNDNANLGIRLIPIRESTIDPRERSTYKLAGVLIFIVVGLVLLIACANVANLLLSRGAARRTEITVRLALGAGRGTIIRQLMTESLLLAALGGGFGYLFAKWGIALLWASRPPSFASDLLSAGFDRRVLGFVLLVSVLTGLLFGLSPALQLSRTDLALQLRDRTQMKTGSRSRMRGLLAASQVGFSIVSLVAIWLFAQSLRRIEEVPLGFDADRLLIVRVDLGGQGYDDSRARQFHRTVESGVEAVPGVFSASFASNPPLTAGFLREIHPEGEEPIRTGFGTVAYINSVGTKYFETLGIPVLFGRTFTDQDREGSPRVAVINEAMARRFWSNRNPIGRRFRLGGDSAFLEVIGVAKDSKLVAPTEVTRPCVYMPLAQVLTSQVTLYVRARGSPAGLMTGVLQVIRGLDGTLPLIKPSLVSQVVEQSLWVPRLIAWLLGSFGVLALVIAVGGLYGHTAYTVTQRLPEIALRVALGARSSDIIRMVIFQGLRSVLAGALIGAAVAFGCMRIFAKLFFGVSAADPFVTAIPALALLSAAFAALYAGARRAARITPGNLLRI